jgi:hypothetical protein
MPKNTTPRPNTQTDEVVREMTEAEYQELLATGWTAEGSGHPSEG